MVMQNYQRSYKTHIALMVNGRSRNITRVRSKLNNR